MEKSNLKPTDLPSDREVRFWLRQFGLKDDQTTPQTSSEPPVDSPLPPGYGDNVRKYEA